MNIESVLNRLFPKGTNLDLGSSDLPPRWPPDLFAFVAYLTDISSIYTDSLLYETGSNSFLGKTYYKRVKRVSKQWLSTLTPPRRIQLLWKLVTSKKTLPIDKLTKEIKCAIIEMLAISDEVSAGIGIDEETFFSRFANELYLSSIVHRNTHFLTSLCLAVPDLVVCVQPKTITSQVGCTLRSLSHHLALLPASSQVKTKWLKTTNHVSISKPLNLMLVPYPYEVNSNSFIAGKMIEDENSSSGYFHLNQTWLPKTKKLDIIFDYINNLIKLANVEVGEVNGIVLPEAALDLKTAKSLAKKLSKVKGIEFFICGALDLTINSKRNVAYASVFHDKDNFLELEQCKHHKWKLEKNQIERYRLERSLDPKNVWWEDTQINNRETNFVTFRSGASMTVLVCEDLARIDPIQPVLRSIGPNLLIALLQDGPQKNFRWPARYATVLSDDPGSAVLTLTSLGMVKRSMQPTDKSFENTIALWKDPKGGLKELSLQEDEAALVLELKFSNEEAWTLDGRSDNDQSVQISLVSSLSIKGTRLITK